MTTFFPKNLKYLMSTQRLTQEALAERLGVSRGSVAKWLAGDNLPSLEHLRIMRVLFDRQTIDELLEEDLILKDAQQDQSITERKILDALEEIKAVLKKRKAERHRKNNNRHGITSPFLTITPQFA